MIPKQIELTTIGELSWILIYNYLNNRVKDGKKICEPTPYSYKISYINRSIYTYDNLTLEDILVLSKYTNYLEVIGKICNDINL